ncbi:MAG: outer membrane beta-barrel protein [bacterium]
MKRLIIVVFCMLSYSILSAQNYEVKGQVFDLETKNKISETNCLLIHLPDSTERGTKTNSQGKFYFGNVKSGKYSLQISYMGYKRLIQEVTVKNKSVNLNELFMEKGSVSTIDVEVVAKVLPVVQNADTTEFNAKAFKINEDADTENLLTKMPGVTVKDGTVTVLGEQVKKVLVDGKTFFGDDPSAVLKNIPAEIVEKIQVFDQQSEQSQFTGFNDGNTTKTINVVTRVGIKEGTFGKIYGGLSEDKRYKLSGNYNIFQNDQRISILTQLNNINEQNFTPEDLLGVMASSERGGGRQGGGFRGGNPPEGGSAGGGVSRPGGGFGGGNPNDFLVQTKNGVTKTIAAGLNYSNKIGSFLSISSSYFYNNTKTEASSDIDRYYYQTENVNQSYFETNNSKSTNINHRFNMKLDFTIDSLNSIMLRPILSYQKNDGFTNTFGTTLIDALLLNNINSYFNSNLSALSTSIELLYRHKFLTKGRTISVGLKSGYNKNDGDNYLGSGINYIDYLIYNDTTNQISNLDKKGTNYSANFQYTEPLNENNNLLISYFSSISNDDSKQYTDDYSLNTSSYSNLDTLLSNVYNKKYFTNNFGLGYRYQMKKIRFTAGVSYNLTKLTSKETFPYSQYTEKSFNSVLPALMFRFGISRDMNLDFNYRTNNNEPSIDQLQNVLNNTNTSQLTIGNPNLKQDYRHNISLRYSVVNLTTMQSLFIMLSSTITKNYIGNNVYVAQKDTIINNTDLGQGVQLSRPENMDGYFNIRSFLSYGYMLDLIKSNINLNLSVSYSKTPSILNNIKIFSKSTIYGAGLFLSSNISEDFDFTIGSNSSYTDTKSSKSSSNSSYFNQDSRLKLYWKFWSGFLFQTEVNHQYDTGLSSSYNRNSISLNLNLGKKLFSNNSGEVRLSVNDLLNQNTNIQRTTSDSYYQDTKSNVLGRYYLLSFIYNIRAFN